MTMNVWNIFVYGVLCLVAGLVFGAEEVHQPSSLSLDILFFETADIDPKEILAVAQAQKAGLSVSVVGRGIDYIGFGQKWRIIRDALANLASDALVVVADTRDTLLNNHHNAKAAEGAAVSLVSRVVKSYEAIVEDHAEAVVFGTEFECCVNALTHAKLGEYFDVTGTKRMKRACDSKNEDDCSWNGAAHALPWLTFQVELAKDRTGIDVADAFLNGGLVIGTAKNLLNIIDLADLEDTEDDQAVFTGLMHRRPDLIMLDYGNEIFGTSRYALGMESGCIFQKSSSGLMLEHEEFKSVPLILHTPNRFFQCYDKMASMLGEVRSASMMKWTGVPVDRISVYEGLELQDEIVLGAHELHGDDATKEELDRRLAVYRSRELEDSSSETIYRS